MGKLVKDVYDGKMLNIWDVLNYVMDSVVMFGNINWKFNMKWWELIKFEFNFLYICLCKEDIVVFIKLFGDDLFKYLKDMFEVKKVG